VSAPQTVYTTRNNHNAIRRPQIPFKFNEEYAKKVQTIISRYPAQYRKAAVIPVLDLGQRQNGWTSLAVMNHVAEVLEMPR
jgi:NADH dehydrogenase (ubiquinone) flavoprotein 2